MTLADILNSPTEKTFEGKTYRLREPNGIEQGEFQRWLEQLAYDKINSRTYQSDEEKERRLDRHDKSCAVGDYEWGGELSVRRLQTVPGFAKLLSIVLREQGLTPEAAERWANLKYRECAAVVMRRVYEDPKDLRAACVALGLPPDFLSNSPTPPSTTDSTTSEASAPSS
jgi:hypothetical protein